MSSVSEYFLDQNQDISFNIVGQGQTYHVSIYNDKTNKSVSTQISKDKLKGLINFINSYLGNK